MAHNKSAYQSNNQEPIDVDKFSGEARVAIEAVLGTEVSYDGGSFVVQEEHIYGRGHDDGLRDNEGRQWWLSVEYPNGYHASYKVWDNL